MYEQRKLTEIKSVDTQGAGTFSGLLSTYNTVDEYGDIIEPGAYTQTIMDNAGRLPLLWNHDQNTPIGELMMRDGQKGLEVDGRLLLSDDVPQAKTAYALLKSGIVRGLSIGFKAIQKKPNGSIRRLKEIKLYEGSLVTIPANSGALVTEVRSARSLAGIQQVLDRWNADLDALSRG